MATGKGTIQICATTKPISSITDVTAKTPELDPEECKYWIELCEETSAVFKFVGVVNEPRLSMQTISENARRIGSAYGLIHPETGRVALAFSLVTELGEINATPLSFDVLCVDCLELGGIYIGYHALARMIGNSLGDKIEWQSENVTLKGMMQLHSMPLQYEQMIEAAQKEAGCKNVFRGDLNKPAPITQSPVS